MIHDKMVILGNSAVGKTSIISQYIYQSWSSEHHPTVGIDFFAKTVNLNGCQDRLPLWDTAGARKFHALVPAYLRSARIAILVYDVTSRESFEGLDQWYEFIFNQTSPVLFVVGNKADLQDFRQVATEEGKE
jgi:Ras-related protein Rab-6A